MYFIIDMYQRMSDAGRIYICFCIIMYLFIEKFQLYYWEADKVTICMFIFCVICSIVRAIQFYVVEDAEEKIQQIEEDTLTGLEFSHEYEKLISGVRAGFKFESAIISLYIIYLCVMYLVCINPQ